MQEFNRSGYDNLYPQIIPNFSQNVDLNSNRIINVASPVNDNDGVNKKYVDTLQVFSFKKVGTITRMGQAIPFNTNDALNCYGLILDYTLGSYSYGQGAGVYMGISDSYGNIYNSYQINMGGNSNPFQLNTKVFFEKDPITSDSYSVFDFNLGFKKNSLYAQSIVQVYHYFCCKGISDTPAANATINMDIYFLM